MAWRRAIPILTEEQRSAIRMGWRAGQDWAPGEWEAEHAQRIRDRAERTGLPINKRAILMEVEKVPPGENRHPGARRWGASKVSKGAAGVEQTEFGGGEGPEDDAPATGAVGE
jgi:hypothetical protein